MNFEIESQRNKFIAKYDINIEKYTTDEIVNDLEVNIANVFLFALNILIPILVTCLISTTTSVYFTYSYDSILFGVLLFVFSIPIFLFGAGSFGLVRAVNTLCSSVSYILDYLLDIVTDIKKINNTNDTFKNEDIFQFTLYGIIFPLVKKCMRDNLFGEILSFFIRKISLEGSKLLSDSYEKKEPIKKATNKVNDISKKVVRNIIKVFKIFGVISILFGLILEVLLFFVR